MRVEGEVGEGRREGEVRSGRVVTGDLDGPP